MEQATRIATTTDRPASEERFDWHPTYQGKAVSEVRTTLTNELASDQRAYALALEGAEEHENSALATVLELEKKWGKYDLDWATADPSLLASQIVAFEQEREHRQELIPYTAYRDHAKPSTNDSTAASPGSTRTVPMPSLPAIAIAVAVLVLIAIVLLVQL